MPSLTSRSCTSFLPLVTIRLLDFEGGEGHEAVLLKGWFCPVANIENPLLALCTCPYNGKKIPELPFYHSSGALEWLKEGFKWLRQKSTP
jgi:hypothetical protein